MKIIWLLLAVLLSNAAFIRCDDPDDDADDDPDDSDETDDPEERSEVAEPKKSTNETALKSTNETALKSTNETVPEWMPRIEKAIRKNEVVLEEAIVTRLRKELLPKLNGTVNASTWMPVIEDAIRTNNVVLGEDIVTRIRGEFMTSLNETTTPDWMPAIEDAIRKNNVILGEAIVTPLLQDLVKSADGKLGVCERRSSSTPPPISLSEDDLIKELKKDFSKALEIISTHLYEAKIKVMANIGKNYQRQQNSEFTQLMVQLTKNFKIMEEGIKATKKAFLDRIEEAEIALTKEERSRILRDLEILVLGKVKNGAKRSGVGEAISNEKIGASTDMLEAATDAAGHIVIMIDPSLSWQERTEAGLNTGAKLVGLLPSPVGEAGSVVFGLVAACFGASAPTTNEYKQLRNQIMDGMKDLFDETQKMEAIGCIYKIEFLKGLLEVNDRSALTDKEFYAIILAGGIDVGVSTLGTFKYKMETFRDKNTVQSGRDALDMAHFYVKVAEARDILHNQIINFIGISGSKAGITARFFKSTQQMAQKDYQHLFFWEDKCCVKNEKHFSALLAYNLPVKKHSGKENAVDEVSKFIKKYRTTAYYKNNDVSADTVLSYDESTGTGTNKEYTVGTRGPELDENYYKYQQVNWNDFYLGVPAQNYRLPVVNNYLICDRDKTRYIMKMGVSKTTAKMRFVTSPDPGDPLVGKIPSFVYQNDDFFLGSTSVFRDKLKPFMKEFGFNHNLTNSSVDVYLKQNIISCVVSKPKIKNREWSPTVHWKEYIESGKIRFFKVKFANPKWKEPLFLVSPVVVKPDDDEKLYLITADSHKGEYNDIPKPVSDADKEKSLTPDVLYDEKEWKNIWFKQIPQ